MDLLKKLDFNFVDNKYLNIQINFMYLSVIVNFNKKLLN